MLRTRWITSASNAKLYYQVSDYYAKTAGDWLGRGAEMLGLRGEVKKEDFQDLDVLSKNFRVQFNDNDTLRRNWGGGVMGIKN